MTGFPPASENPNTEREPLGDLSQELIPQEPPARDPASIWSTGRHTVERSPMGIEPAGILILTGWRRYLHNWIGSTTSPKTPGHARRDAVGAIVPSEDTMRGHGHRLRLASARTATQASVSEPRDMVSTPSTKGKTMLKHQALKLGMWYAQPGSTDDVPEDVCSTLLLEAFNEELATEGYVVVENTLAGQSVSAEPSKLAQLQTPRSLRKYRTDEICIRILEWVDRHPDQGISVADLADTDGRDFTGDFTRDEFHSAGERLKDGGYIKGIGADGGHVIRPEITSLGERCLDSGYAPNDFENGDVTRVSNTANFNAPVGGFQQGNYNSMSVTQNNTDVNELLAMIREQVPVGNAEANDLVKSLEQAARSGSGGRATVNALVTGLATAVGSHAGQRIIELGAQLLATVRF